MWVQIPTIRLLYIISPSDVAEDASVIQLYLLHFALQALQVSLMRTPTATLTNGLHIEDMAPAIPSLVNRVCNIIWSDFILPDQGSISHRCFRFRNILLRTEKALVALIFTCYVYINVISKIILRYLASVDTNILDPKM